MNDAQLRATRIRNTVKPLAVIVFIVAVLLFAIIAFLSLPPTTPAHAATQPPPSIDVPSQESHSIYIAVAMRNK